MVTGIRLFHSRITLKNYILVKPTENKCFLYELNKDGSIEKNAKPLLKKTYEKYNIIRNGKVPSADTFKNSPHRYHIWKSRVPRNINSIPDGLSQEFTIRNRDGGNGSVVDIIGTINKAGINSVEKLKFPLTGYDTNGITNLARIYLKKAFGMFSATEPNKNTYYVSEKYDKLLKELDKEYNIPEFKITEEISNSIEKLRKKHRMTN